MTATFLAIVFAAVLQGGGLKSSYSAPVHGVSVSAVTLLAQVDAPTSTQDATANTVDATNPTAAQDTSVAQDQPTAADQEPDMARGFAIAITGMLIVATALLLIIGFISALPKALIVLEKYFPESDGHHGRKNSHPESQVADDEAVLAAIGYVLHSRIGGDK